MARAKIDPPQERKVLLARDATDVIVRKAVRMGVRIGVWGSILGVYPHRRNPQEFWLLAERGFSPIRQTEKVFFVMREGEIYRDDWR